MGLGSGVPIPSMKVPERGHAREVRAAREAELEALEPREAPDAPEDLRRVAESAARHVHPELCQVHRHALQLPPKPEAVTLQDHLVLQAGEVQMQELELPQGLQGRHQHGGGVEAAALGEAQAKLPELTQAGQEPVDGRVVLEARAAGQVQLQRL